MQYSTTVNAGMSVSAPARAERNLIGFYDRLAPRYDRLHRRWLRRAGGGAQTALEAAVRALAQPDTRLLDAGCGTGAFARRLLADDLPTLQLTLLDPSPAMLNRCADVSAERRLGRLESLPFPDASFDLVTCAWALETVADAQTAVSELCRVVSPGGAVCLAFCAQKDGVTPVERLMRAALRWRGAGRFLDPRAVARMLRDNGLMVRVLPCAGPATALLAYRPAYLPMKSARRSNSAALR